MFYKRFDLSRSKNFLFTFLSFPCFLFNSLNVLSKFQKDHCTRDWSQFGDVSWFWSKSIKSIQSKWQILYNWRVSLHWCWWNHGLFWGLFIFFLPNTSDRPNVPFGRTSNVRFGPNDRTFFCRTQNLFSYYIQCQWHPFIFLFCWMTGQQSQKWNETIISIQNYLLVC